MLTEEAERETDGKDEKNEDKKKGKETRGKKD